MKHDRNERAYMKRIGY